MKTHRNEAKAASLPARAVQTATTQNRPAPTRPSPSIKPPTLCSQFPVKRRGEIGEAAFLYKAATLGFSVAKPWGDSDRYDFIVENGARSWRVQVYARGEHNYCVPCKIQPR